jgi:hypothetical protein
MLKRADMSGGLIKEANVCVCVTIVPSEFELNSMDLPRRMHMIHYRCKTPTLPAIFPLHSISLATYRSLSR